MSSTPRTTPDLVRYVQEHADARDLAALDEAVKSRRRILQMEAAEAVNEGAAVTLRDIKPEHLAGLTGVVKSIDRAARERHAVVTLDEKSTQALRRSGPDYDFLRDGDTFDVVRVPLTCCAVARA